ncbi:enoyl-CoA hydratase/isomerase family protein [Micrococcales bacterium 31B]|nr:enoyl-CoA hydratase/isomerase family protein [Micrococcales bacterium 31B]
MPQTAERITRSLVTRHELPGGAGTLALITLDNGTSAPASFGPEGLREFAETLTDLRDEAANEELVAVAITGTGKTFCAGADLRTMPSLVASAPTPHEGALALGRMGHEAFSALADLGVPTFAFVNGTALGGGLELALNCTYRVGLAGARPLGLPETYLGLVPGWGGCYLLPRLIGVPAAISVIVENPLANNRTLTAQAAAELGILDRVVTTPDEFFAFVADTLTSRHEIVRTEAGSLSPEDRSVIAAARAAVTARLHDAVIAPYRALDLIEAALGRTREEGFAAEDDALAECMLSPQNAAALYAFELTSSYGKKVAAQAGGTARPINRIGVVGAGLMAAQLALVFATHLRVPVHMTDLDDARVSRGLGFVAAELDKGVSRGRLKPADADAVKQLVTGSIEIADHAEADWVIEAVFEDMGVKQAVFADLERVVRPDCLLATNTSSLSVDVMAEGLQHPERLVGFHFFNPVAAMPLVEVIRHERVSDDTVATALAVGAALRKTCVIVKNAPGFVVNRLLLKMMCDVMRAVDGGTPFAEADHALDSLGLPMTPYVLTQLVGPAVGLHVAEVLHRELGERFHVSPSLARAVADKRTVILTEDASDLVPEVAAAIPGPTAGAAPQTGPEILDYVLAELTREIDLMLSEGVVADRRDIDLCMILGAGWPFHLGGITPYLNSSGVAERVLGHRIGG